MPDPRNATVEISFGDAFILCGLLNEKINKIEKTITKAQVAGEEPRKENLFKLKRCRSLQQQMERVIKETRVRKKRSKP